jgi:hypothetical protein
MKRSTFSKALPLAAVLAFAAAGSASYADMASYNQLEQGVINDLNGLGVDTHQIGMLTMAELTSLAAILEGSDSETAKADAAKKMIVDATMAPERVQANSGRAQIAANVMVELEALGMKLPTKNPLSPSQLARLAVVLDSDRTDANKKTAAEVILAENLPPTTPFGMSGIMQLEEELEGKFAAVGIEAPAKGSLTLSQVAELSVIFDGMDPDADKKAAAMKVLSGT